MTNKRKGKVGSSFDAFLAEQGILEECEEQAIKQILADQIKAAMEKDRLTKAAMAIRMHTSRRALDRLLDPTNTSVTLHTPSPSILRVAYSARSERIGRHFATDRYLSPGGTVDAAVPPRLACTPPGIALTTVGC